MLVGFPLVSPLQSFHLKVESDNTDGSTTITESIPCEAGSSTELCMVEVCVLGGDKKQAREGVVATTIIRSKSAVACMSIDVC